MRVAILDPGRPGSFAPLTLTRDLLDCYAANLPLRRLLEEHFTESGLQVVDRADDSDLVIRGDTWLSAETLRLLGRQQTPFLLEDSAGSALAWEGGGINLPEERRRLAAGSGDFRLTYPWDLLRVNELVVGSIKGNKIGGSISPGATAEGLLHLGRGSVLLPGTYIEGNAVIGRDCRIGPNCYIRGSTSIGDGCRIGHSVEVKNSILFPGSAIGHLSYCGDSVIGSHVNLGAGTIVANFRHDGINHRSEVEGLLVDTGRRKLGTVMGDGVHTGIHTSIYPGRKLWPGVSTRPGAIIQHDLHPEPDPPGSSGRQ